MLVLIRQRARTPVDPVCDGPLLELFFEHHGQIWNKHVRQPQVQVVIQIMSQRVVTSNALQYQVVFTLCDSTSPTNRFSRQKSRKID